MKTTTTKPCKECPFRRDSWRGWLGPWNVEDLLWALGREAFPCHKTITGRFMAMDDPALVGCAGAAIFLNNKSERSRHPYTAAHQKAVAGIPAAEKAAIFTNGNEFREHHNVTRSGRHLKRG
jgi:hypothetical protein